MRPKQFKLTRREQNELERRYKQERDKRAAERIQCILLLDEGRNAAETAAILRVSVKTIKRWIKIFATYGIEGLCKLNYENSGKRCELSVDEQDELEKYLQSQLCGSAKEVMDYIEREFGVKYSESGVLKLLKRMDYSYKKPAVIPSKADLEQQSAFVELYEKKKSIDGRQ